MKIKSKRTVTYSESYHLSFEYIGSNGCGCQFNCDKDGNVDLSKLNHCALQTYNTAMSGEVTRREDMTWRKNASGEWEPDLNTGNVVTRKVTKGEVITSKDRCINEAIGECNRCGRDVHLYGFTNTCECGADYNMSGQELAPRSQWGEETGESLDDILKIK